MKFRSSITTIQNFIVFTVLELDSWVHSKKYFANTEGQVTRRVTILLVLMMSI